MTRYFLCLQQDLIDTAPRSFDIASSPSHDAMSVILIRHENSIYCYQNRCPHLGIPLNWQPDDFLSIEQTHLQCSTHGALFNFHDGQCVMGPCINEHLTTLVTECDENDKIWLKMA